MFSKNFEITLRKAFDIAISYKHAYTTLEHLLLALIEDPDANGALLKSSANIALITQKINNFLASELQSIILEEVQESKPSLVLRKVIHRASSTAQASGFSEMNGIWVLAELMDETDSFAALFLKEQNVNKKEILKKTVFSPNSARSSLSIQSVQQTGEEKTEPNQDVLSLYCTNLNKLAEENKIDSIIGRDAEVQRAVEILSRRNKNNPLLVGEPGVGKTAIAEGLALSIVKNQVPDSLKGATVFSLDLGALVAGTRFRGDFEERLKLVLKKIQEIPLSILFIDEIHTIIGAGSNQGGSLDAGNLLKPALARSNLRCMGATTFKEYQLYFEKDAALARRFQKVVVDEPTVETSILMLKGIKSFYEKHHNVTYTEEAIEECVKLSHRFINDRRLPDKAIDVMDEAGAYCKLNNIKVVSEEVVENIIAKISHLPTKTVAQEDAEQVRNLASHLKTVIFGQDKAIDDLVSIIKLDKAGLRHHEKPTGCYLFSGPSGVGKTELAREVAKALGMNLLRFDMSEYMEKHSVSRLIGAPPGYIGFDQAGLLTERVRKAPYSLVLLDEIEKAHPDIHNILLQIMDYGKLTDSNGVTVNFTSTIIIMTTNAGVAINKHNIGFNELKQIVNNTRESNEHINRSFSPEFRNRLDAIIEFSSLSEAVINRIVDKYIKELENQLAEKHISIIVDQAARDFLADFGFNSYSGARELEKIIDKKLKQPLAEEILSERLKENSKFKIEYDFTKNQLNFIYEELVPA